MPQKSEVVLDIPAMCTLSVDATTFVTETTADLDVVTKYIQAMKDNDGILSGGYKGQAIADGLEELDKICKSVNAILEQIKDITKQQIDNMARAIATNPELESSKETIISAKKKMDEITDVKEQIRAGKKK